MIILFRLFIERICDNRILHFLKLKEEKEKQWQYDRINPDAGQSEEFARVSAQESANYYSSSKYVMQLMLVINSWILLLV